MDLFALLESQQKLVQQLENDMGKMEQTILSLEKEKTDLLSMLSAPKPPLLCNNGSSYLIDQAMAAKLRKVQQILFELSSHENQPNGYAQKVKDFPMDYELARQYDQLYSEGAIDTFDELEDRDLPPSIVPQLFKAVCTAAQDFVEEIALRTTESVFPWTRKGDQLQIPASITAFVRLGLQAHFNTFRTTFSSKVAEKALQQLLQSNPSIPIHDLPCLQLFISKLYNLALAFAVSYPSRFSLELSPLMFDQNSHIRSFDSKTMNESIEYYEWPILLLNGKVLSKGIVRT